MQKSEKDKYIFEEQSPKNTFEEKKTIYSCIYDQRFKYVEALFDCWCDRCVGIRTFVKCLITFSTDLML